MITIENKTFELSVNTTDGGRINTIKHKGLNRDILYPLQDVQSNIIPEGGSYPLVPYSNRIVNGQFQWNDKVYTLAPHPQFAPHSIHGVVCYEAWNVTEHTNNSLTIAYQHKANQSWPWDFIAIQCFTIQEDSVQHTLSIQNTDMQSQPIGLGFHPFFSAQGLQTLQYAVRGYWDADEACIPKACIDVPNGYDYSTAKPFSQVDAIFEGWNGEFCATYDTYKLSIVASDTCTRVVVFSNDVSKFFCFEPVENMTNAYNLAKNEKQFQDYGLTVLDGGESHSITMTMAIECL